MLAPVFKKKIKGYRKRPKSSTKSVKELCVLNGVMASHYIDGFKNVTFKLYKGKYDVLFERQDL